MSYAFEGSNFIVCDIRQKLVQYRNPNYPYGWRGGGSRHYTRDLTSLECVVYHQTAGGLTPGEAGPITTAQYSIRDPRFLCPACGRFWRGNKNYPHSHCPQCGAKGENRGYGNGFPGMPYHVFVPWEPERLNGKAVVYWCQPFEEITWHASKGNATGVGVGWQGLFRSRHLRRFVPHPGTDGDPSQFQKEIASPLWQEWLQPTLNLPATALSGHFEFGKASCPGDWLETRVRTLRGEPGLTVHASTSHVVDTLFCTWEARQAALFLLGYHLGTYGPLKNGVDGKPGYLTKMAIAAFQSNHNLVPDGVWDEQVQQAMFSIFFEDKELTVSELEKRLTLEGA
jgi:hypothetical protein